MEKSKTSLFCRCTLSTDKCATNDAPVSKYTSPMRLLDLLWKVKSKHHDLTNSEKSILSVLITYVNLEGISNKGYDAYPSTDLLVESTGYGLSIIEKSRKTLQEKGWIKIIGGKAKGHANHYHINASKIVDAYKSSDPGIKIDIFTGNHFDFVMAVKSKTQRNISGLMQGKRQPTAAHKTDSSINPADDSVCLNILVLKEFEMVI